MNIPQRQLFYNLLNFSLPILFNTLIETNKAIKNIINTKKSEREIKEFFI